MGLSRLIQSNCSLTSNFACFCRIREKYLHRDSPCLLFFVKTGIKLKVLTTFFLNKQLKRNNSWKSTAQAYCVQVLHKLPRTYFCHDTHFFTSFLICNILVPGPDPNPPAMNVSFSVGFRLPGIQSRHLGSKEHIRNAGSGGGGGCERYFHNVGKQPSIQMIVEISSCIEEKAGTVFLTVLVNNKVIASSNYP